MFFENPALRYHTLMQTSTYKRTEKILAIDVVGAKCWVGDFIHLAIAR